MTGWPARLSPSHHHRSLPRRSPRPLRLRRARCSVSGPHDTLTSPIAKSALLSRITRHAHLSICLRCRYGCSSIRSHSMHPLIDTHAHPSIHPRVDLHARLSICIRGRAGLLAKWMLVAERAAPRTEWELERALSQPRRQGVRIGANCGGGGKGSVELAIPSAEWHVTHAGCRERESGKAKCCGHVQRKLRRACGARRQAVHPGVGGCGPEGRARSGEVPSTNERAVWRSAEH